jgi:hypothetical protein
MVDPAAGLDPPAVVLELLLQAASASAKAALAATAMNRTGRWRVIRVPGGRLGSPAAGAAGPSVVDFIVPP